MAFTVPFSRGVNFSKWFEARSFKDIVFDKYSEQDFADVKSLGADVVRLPVAFHNFTIRESDCTEGDCTEGDCTLHGGLLKYLDTAADWAEKNQIYLIIENHSFHPIDPTDSNIDRILIPVWEQLALHFKDRSDFVLYEILNEPHGIPDERWDTIQGAAIDAVRKIDKQHMIIAGGTNYNSIEKMTKVSVYKSERIIYTFHFYDPHIFTHQGATWNKPSLAPLSGLPFPSDGKPVRDMHESFKGTWVEENLKSYNDDSKLEKLCATLDKASNFSKEKDVPVFCGEFGVFMVQSPPEDRVKWYAFICEELKKRGIPWACWDYFGGFGLFKTQFRGKFPDDLNSDIVRAMGFTN